MYYNLETDDSEDYILSEFCFNINLCRNGKIGANHIRIRRICSLAIHEHSGQYGSQK